MPLQNVRNSPFTEPVEVNRPCCFNYLQRSPTDPKNTAGTPKGKPHPPITPQIRSIHNPHSFGLCLGASTISATQSKIGSFGTYWIVCDVNTVHPAGDVDAAIVRVRA
jgi:hypothetical protein